MNDRSTQHPRRSLLAVAVVIFGCGDRVATPSPDPGSGTGSAAVVESSPHEKELLALWELEKKARKTIDWAAHPPSDATLGSDPYRIVRVRDRFVGILRGESAVVLLDKEAKELARAEAPRSPTAIAVFPDGDVLVAGERSNKLGRYRVAADKLEEVASYPVAASSIRGLAIAPDGKTVYLVEERAGRLLAVTGMDGKTIRTRELGRCHGPIGVEAVADLIVTNCLLDRAIEIRRGATVEKIQHDGPMWGFDVRLTKDGKIYLAAGGVEDHPLERADGGFGFIDSYLFLYRLDAKPKRLAEINLSEFHGLTPKWLEIYESGDMLAVETAGFGGGKHIIVSWPQRIFDRKPDINAWKMPPGIADSARIEGEGGAQIFANPLLDGWVVLGPLGSKPPLVPAGKKSTRSLESRAGELLFFTELMAPWGGTEGKRSRFTCETCHHEGYTDGRTHFTGREHGGLKVNATTRPLLGLFNNAPYFSRALDQTATQMVHSEFKVANRHSVDADGADRDPWFDLTEHDLPWWSYIDGMPKRVTPEWLREAFLRFLIDFTHRANPAVDHAAFTPLEKRGAETFRDRCASCHAARLIAEEPSTEVAFDRWEKLVLSEPGPLVWNNAAYAKTGVEPYVHDEGTRVPTLRRLYKKWPYFTNGTAKSLAELLDAFAYDKAGAIHAGQTAAMTKLTADEKTALLAFLDLL